MTHSFSFTFPSVQIRSEFWKTEFHKYLPRMCRIGQMYWLDQRLTDVFVQCVQVTENIILQMGDVKYLYSSTERQFNTLHLNIPFASFTSSVFSLDFFCLLLLYLKCQWTKQQQILNQQQYQILNKDVGMVTTQYVRSNHSYAPCRENTFSNRCWKMGEK